MPSAETLDGDMLDDVECLTCMCDCPFCPEHGEVDLWDGDSERYTFLFINDVLVGELDGGRSISGATGTIISLPNAITITAGDEVSMREFDGPVTNYETWREP